MHRTMKFVAMLSLGLVFAMPAEAGLWRDVFRGLDLLATPSGGPLIQTADGTRVNGQRAGRLRIVPNEIGRGYTLEFDRSFGADSTGRPEILDLGPLELQLAGATQMDLGFTRRGFFTASGNLLANQLNYQLSAKTGAVDTVLSGQLDVSNNFEINQFGFYTLSINVANTNSTLTVDGVAQAQSEDTNFDIGPINVRGNIFIDAIVALLASAGVDTGGFSSIFRDSPFDQIGESFQEFFNRQTAVAGLTLNNPLVELGPTAITPQAALVIAPGDSAVGGANVIPEPGTLALVLAGLGLIATRRR